VSAKWAIAMPPNEAATLGPLRCRGEIEVCGLPEAIWIRGPAADEDLDLKLRALPGRRFTLLSDNQLVAHGATVPLGYGPEGPWIRLRQWLTAVLPQAALSGCVAGTVTLRMVRGGSVAEANLLIALTEHWRGYIDTAPQVRLDGLAFALSDDGRVVVRGQPLPPLPGERFVESHGLAMPAGFTWEPALASEVVRTALRLPAADLAIFHRDGTWDRVRQEDFVRATRSAVRASLSRGQDG